MSKADPYLTITFDARRRSALVASALGVHKGFIEAGLLDLWEHAWREKTEIVGELLLASCFGADGRALPHLALHGFLEPIGEGQYRIRGSERYLRIRRARSEAGKLRAAEASRDPNGRLSTSKTPAHGGEFTSKSPPPSQPLQRSSNSDQLTTTSTRGTFTPGQVPALPVRVGTEPTFKGPAVATGPTPLDVVAGAFQRARGARPGWADSMAAEADMRGIPFHSLEQLDAVAERAFREARYPKTATPKELRANWEHFAAPAPAETGPPRSAARGRATEADKQHGNTPTRMENGIEVLDV